MTGIHSDTIRCRAADRLTYEDFHIKSTLTVQTNQSERDKVAEW